MNAATAIADTHAEMQLENAERFEAALRDAVEHMPDDYRFPNLLQMQHEEAKWITNHWRIRLGLTASSSERAGGV